MTIKLTPFTFLRKYNQHRTPLLYFVSVLTQPPTPLQREQEPYCFMSRRTWEGCCFNVFLGEEGCLKKILWVQEFLWRFPSVPGKVLALKSLMELFLWLGLLLGWGDLMFKFLKSEIFERIMFLISLLVIFTFR